MKFIHNAFWLTTEGPPFGKVARLVVQLQKASRPFQNVETVSPLNSPPLLRY